MEANSNQYDVAFAGFGTSAALMVHSLEKRGLLSGKRMAILDPVDQQGTVKNFCFWTTPNDAIVTDHEPCIDQRWSRVLAAGNLQELHPLEYCHVNGSQLIASAKEILSRHQSSWFSNRVLDVQPVEGSMVCTTVENQIIASVVLDSRTPEFKTPAKPEVLMWQSFRGWVIESTKTFHDPHCFTMMDVSIEQDGGFQFMYLLPLKENKILVEVTRFGSEVLEDERAEELIKKYLERLTADYKIKDVEKGVIPMCNVPAQPSKHYQHIYLGTRSGAVKPSTGYAFKKMYEQAEVVAAEFLTKSSVKIKKVVPELPGGASSIRSRFGFYDSLLLILLSKWPGYGRAVFSKLYQKVGIVNVLNFLDQKSSLIDDIKIFSSLPIWPFIKSLIWREWHLLKRCRAEWATIGIASLLILWFKTAPESATTVSAIAFVAGLLLIGIPHGAVDHLLESGNFNARINLWFVVKYLIQSALIVMLWWVSPITALLIFLIYSAWHFGQADVEEMSGMAKPGRLKIANLIQGVLTLTILLLSHPTEVNQVFSEYGIGPMSESWQSAASPAAFLLLIFSLLNRSYQGVLGTLLLILTMWLPLMPAFGLFFIGQHSWRSWHHIKKELGVSDWSLYRKSLLFHTGAWLILVLIWITSEFWPPVAGIKMGWPALLFIFLAALSFPHVLAMHGFYIRSARLKNG
ncbi:MAG: beta-carotene 15,15'-dioxygenase, Brp/Blh family [Bacteroidetes bacterium]|nr:beta-carotene 15,15'-dioxygenase, Brp/Blh family [Bacteroidota bacterium]